VVSSCKSAGAANSLVEQREQEMWRRMDVTGSSLGDGKPEGASPSPLGHPWNPSAPATNSPARQPDCRAPRASWALPSPTTSQQPATTNHQPRRDGSSFVWLVWRSRLSCPRLSQLRLSSQNGEAFPKFQPAPLPCSRQPISRRCLTDYAVPPGTPCCIAEWLHDHDP
jgi:hypothetical protein